MLQIGEVQQPPAGLFGGVGLFKVFHQGEERPDGGAHGLQVGQEGGAAVGKAVLQLFHALFAGIARRFDPLRLPGAAGHLLAPRRGEGDGQAGPGGVPAPLRPGAEGPQAVDGGGEGGAVVGRQAGVAGGELQGGGELSHPVGRLAAGVFQQ